MKLVKTRQRLDDCNAGIFISATWHQAKKHYTCDTCCGEVPMPIGEKYLKLIVKRNGKFETWRLCQRCAWVIGKKMEMSTTEKVKIRLEKGAFMLHKLASVTQKEWRKILLDSQKQ